MKTGFKNGISDDMINQVINQMENELMGELSAKELKLGNWIINEDGINVQITQISVDIIHYEYISKKGHRIATGASIELFKSIPLTEELLLACSFSYSPNELMEHKDCLFGLEYDSVLKQWNILMLKDYFYLKSIGTLHELQNFYKEIKGKELEINLT